MTPLFLNVFKNSPPNQAYFLVIGKSSLLYNTAVVENVDPPDFG